MADISVEIIRGAPYVRNVKMAYKFAQGPYEESAEIFSEVSKIAPGTKWIGLYYDNPEKVRAADLKYAAGAVLCEGEGTVDPGLQSSLQKAGFKMFQMPNVNSHVLTTYPYVRGGHHHRQVYPQLMKYIDEHNLDLDVMVHIYSRDKVLVMGPQENTDEFFVPEARASQTVQQTCQ